MSDIHDDLRRVESTQSPGRSRQVAEEQALARTQEMARQHLWQHAYDLHEMVMGEPVPHTEVLRERPAREA